MLMQLLRKLLIHLQQPPGDIFWSLWQDKKMWMYLQTDWRKIKKNLKTLQNFKYAIYSASEIRRASYKIF